MSRQRLEPIIDRNIRKFQPETQGQEVLYVNHVKDSFAAGYRVVRLFVSHVANVLTGTLYSCYSRAENHVAGMTGAVVGSAGYAANYAASASGDVTGGEFVALTKGVNADKVRAGFFQIDSDGGETIGEASVIEVNNQAGPTCTVGPYGVKIYDNSDATPSGSPYKAFVFLKSGSNPVGPAIDCSGVLAWATTVNGITLSAGDRPIFATATAVVVLASNNALAVRT